MNRRHRPSACVHYGKPTLEALEDRCMPSQLGNVLSDLAGHILVDRNLDFIHTINEVQSDLHHQANHPSDQAGLSQLFQDIGNAASQVNFFQQQAVFYFNSVLSGVVQGKLDAAEVGDRVQDAFKLVQLAAAAQAQVLQMEGFAVIAAIDLGLNQGSDSTDLASNFDFNALGDQVVGGVVAGIAIF